MFEVVISVAASMPLTPSTAAMVARAALAAPSRAALAEGEVTEICRFTVAVSGWAATVAVPVTESRPCDGTAGGGGGGRRGGLGGESRGGRPGGVWGWRGRHAAAVSSKEAAAGIGSSDVSDAWPADKPCYLVSLMRASSQGARQARCGLLGSRGCTYRGGVGVL